MLPASTVTGVIPLNCGTRGDWVEASTIYFIAVNGTKAVTGVIPLNCGIWYIKYIIAVSGANYMLLCKVS